ncbi:putative serine/threonine-protein kinase ATM [Plasmopara halstedii]
MTTKLNERLEELTAFLLHAQAVESIDETLSHLRLEVSEAMILSRASAQQCTILLFQSAEPPSLLRFLSTSAEFTDGARKREISAARIGVFELLSAFLKVYGAHSALSKQHVIDLYKVCQQTARSDPFNRVKAQALNVVVNALKYAHKHTTSDEIEPRAYVEKLFYDIQYSKAAQTVKGQMLKVIGYLVEKFSAELKKTVSSLLGWIEHELEKQFLSTSPEMMIVNGLLFALARLLKCDAGRYKQNDALRKKVYSYLLTIFATTTNGNLSRYQVTNSAEHFLEKHAQVFHEEIGPNSLAWFSYMKSCCLSDNKTVKQHAFECSNSILQVLNSYLAEAKDDMRKKCLNKVLKEVLPVISDFGASTLAITFALQCLGWFASSIFTYLGAKGYIKIEDKLRVYGESLLALDAKTTAWKWSLICQYVQCIGQFVQHRSDVVLDEGYIMFLERILCHLMTAYPQCLLKSKSVVHKSIAALFVSLSKWTVIDPVVDQFVHHTLLFSIADITDPDQAVRYPNVIYHPGTGELVTNLIYEYEGFWLNFLRLRSERVVGIPCIPTEAGSGDVQRIELKKFDRTLQAIILDSTVKHVLAIIRKLNLSYQFDSQTTKIGRDATGYSPTVPRDHSIMLNLTEFVERILSQVLSSQLCPWIPLIMNQIFASICDLPLVSCFYRIGTVMTKAMHELNYFKSASSVDTTEQTRFRNDFTSCVQQVSSQARFYQDELRLTSSEFVLTAPLGLVAIHAMVGIVKSMLDLGRSFIPAAVVAIAALERWQKQRPNELNDVICDIIPLISAYLNQEKLGEREHLLDKATLQGVKATGSDEASDLAQVQRRLLLLLGRCDGNILLLVSEPSSLITASGIVGGIFSPHFRLELRLSETPLSLALDSVLSHLGNLASQSSVRRVKVSACESYHAMICYLCGKTATHPHTAGTKTDFYDLWREVFARVVRLASDSEKICRSLFEPLLFQLLRWLAINSDTYPFEYSSMLDELTRSMSDSEAAVRTLSARCIATQLSLAVDTRLPQIKAHYIFNRVFSLCRHPGSVQRSGAAVSISYFLQSLREEDGEALTRFAMPCLKNLLYALRLCDSDAQYQIGGDDVAREIMLNAVMKIERGICRFPHLFLSDSSTTYSIDNDYTLHQMTQWLFQQTGAREQSFRRLCRRIFLSFSALISTSTTEWMHNYETVQERKSILAVMVPLSALAHTVITVDWLEQLSACIENYVWVVEMLGDKTRGIFEICGSHSKKKSVKRKHTAEVSDTNENNCQQTLSWAILTFLNCDGSRNYRSKRSRWTEAYLSVLVSLCNFVKAIMSHGNILLRETLDLDNQSLRDSVVGKLVEVLFHRADLQLHNASSFRAIEEFCSYVTMHSPQWAHQMQKMIDRMLIKLHQSLADVSSSESLSDHSDTITSLTLFGSKVLSAELVKSSAADNYAEIFALVARKIVEYGHGSPQDRLVVVAALQAAAASEWNITDIFLKSADRQMYASIYSDVIHMLPTLAVWKRCASKLVSLSLENDFVVNVLIDILRQVACSKVYLRKSAEWDAFTATLVAAVKQFINKLETVKRETQPALSLLQILKHFVELSQNCSSTYVEALRLGPILDIQNACSLLLKQRGCSYLVKADLLQILGLLGPSSILATKERQPSDPILNALIAFVFDEFPIVSVDVSRGSRDFDVFHMLFTEVLHVVEQSKSIAYLKVIYPSLKEAESHLFRVEIKQMLARFSLSLSSGVLNGSVASSEMIQRQMAELLDLLLDPNVDVAIRKILLEEVFTPFVECQTGEILLHFYMMENEKRKSTIISLLATLISASAEGAFEESRIGTVVAFSLVEILYRLVDPDIIRSKINSAFLGHKSGKGRELTMLVCKCASKVVTKIYLEADDLVRLACCAAYNCLLAAISQTQKQEKLYDQILFQSALWSNLVDSALEYELRAETENFVTIPLSSLSTVSLKQRYEVDVLENVRTKRNNSAALQFYTNSSLSMDAVTLTASTVTEPPDINRGASLYQDIEIELDKINQHPCMIPLLRVLVQMKTEFGSNWNAKVMPGWMQRIFDVIVDLSTGLNIRLFLAKVVLNVPSVFSTYSSLWLPAVMKALLDVSAVQKVSEFNYILRDCCNLVLNSWKDVVVSSLDTTTSRFVNTLVKLCPDRNNLVRDSNVLLVTELIALWKDATYINVRELITFMMSGDEDTKIKYARKFVALQIVSAMLVAGLKSELQAEVANQTIEDGILLCMTTKVTSLYTLAAEVGGLYLLTMDQATSKCFLCNLKKLIADSYTSEEIGYFLAILRNVSIHQATIVDSIMLQRLSSVLSKAVSVDAWALLAADTVYNACGNDGVVKDIFTHVQSVLGRFVAHRHSGVQISTLRAITRLLDHLTMSELNRLVASTSEGGFDLFRYYQGHALSVCRGLLFSIAKNLYHKDISDPGKLKVRISLLHGLCDPDEILRNEAYNFWSNFASIKKSCFDRLLSIFGSLHSSELDENWILYATNILLGLSKECNEFKQPLFKISLGGGEYTTTQIDASWEAKAQSMAPLFSVEADKFWKRLQSTQQPSCRNNTALSESDKSLRDTMQSQLIFSPQASVRLKSSYRQSIVDPTFDLRQNRFSTRRNFADSSAVEDKSINDKKLSKRFYQDKYAMLKKHDLAKMTRERHQEHVRIKRAYRAGEFPDIQITQQDIVDPIMALCEVSVETSSLLFDELFSSIVATNEFEKSGIVDELTEKIEGTLTLSKASSVYVGCIVSAYVASMIRHPSLFNIFVLRPKTIGDAGLASGNHHVSQLALEELLIYETQLMAGNMKLKSNESLTECWDLLHKLLSTLHKRDFLVALSLACSTNADSKRALQEQLSGDLPLAIAAYKKAESTLRLQMELLDGDDFVIAKNDAMRCRWQRLNCMETLNSWHALNSEITEAANADTNYLWKQRPPYLEQGVGHYLRSCLGLLEASPSNDLLESLQNFIGDAVRDSAKVKLIQSKFSVELCLAYLASGDKNQTRVCVENFYLNFLKIWRQTSPMATISRMELLQSLSLIVEIDEALIRLNEDGSDICKNENHFGFVNEWKQKPPFTGEEGMVLWSQHTMVQNAITSLMLNRAHDQGVLSNEIRLVVLGIKGHALLQYANAAVSCNILSLASKVLKIYRELCNTHQLPKLNVRMIEVFVSHVLKLIDRQEHKSSDSTSIKLITKYYETATKLFNNVEIMHMMKIATARDQVAVGYLEAKTFAKAAAFYAFNDLDDDLSKKIFYRSLDRFKDSCRRIDAVLSKQSQDDAPPAFLRCRLTYIEFLNDLLYKRQLEKLANFADSKVLIKLLAENVLRGMAAGDRECANYFPGLCDVVSPYPDIVAECKQCVLTDVPLWTCLQWSAQLMALLNGDIGMTIVAILEKLAERYPVALFYDFMVTCRSSRDIFKVDLRRLEVLLANPVMEKFVAALGLIHHPELRLKEGLRKIANLLDENRTSDARQTVELLWRDCFSPQRQLLGAQIGRYNREWSRVAKRDVEKIMGKDGLKMTAKTVSAAREWINNHFSVTPGRYGITKDMKAHLGDFAEWLQEFDHSSCILELPGQYTSHWGPPDPATHVRILSFDSMLGVLASKQLPKKLTAHCSDEKNYTFLVKGGEDLRLDQRIEQLFDVMNQIFKADPRCRDQKLSLTTYNVIPMTQEIGLLEWIDGTSTLKGLVEAQLQIDERCVGLKSNNSQKLDLFNTTAAKAYESFLLEQRGATYSAKVVASRSEDVVDHFAKVHAMIPPDLLRRQLLKLGSTSDVFFLVRDNFLKSLAVFSACSYVLGIGDRHLDNFLLDLGSGRVIGIDFGVSFGAGASVLPVPELIPFRYTRQMNFVFQPYDGPSLLAREMQTVFDALRSKRQVVESVMNVFLHDPLLDWQQSIKIKQKVLFKKIVNVDLHTSHDSNAVMKDVETFAPTRESQSRKKASTLPATGNLTTAWLPNVKIAIARRKLEGVSPALLLKQELSQNPHIKQHLNKYYSLVNAASTGEDGADEIAALSSLEQAQQLLAIATAPDLLGRTFQGWMPWL